MPDINITINVNGEDVQANIPSANKPPVKLIQRKKKLGQESVLRIPPAVEDHTQQRHGILDLLGV